MHGSMTTPSVKTKTPLSDSDMLTFDLSGHTKRVYALGWNTSGDLLASGGVEKTIRIWNPETQKKDFVSELKGHTSAIHQLDWSPLSPFSLATTAADKTIRLWDAKSATLTQTIPLNDEHFNLTHSPDGHYIVASNKQCVSLIDIRTGKLLDQTVLPVEVNDTKFSASGLLFAAAAHPTGHGTVEIMKIAPNGSSVALENVEQVTAHFGGCLCLDFDPLGRYFAVGGYDSLVTLWDYNDLYCIRSFTESVESIATVSFSSQGSMLAFCGWTENRPYLDLTCVETGQQLYTLAMKNRLDNLKWHPQSPLLAYVGHTDTSDPRQGMIQLLKLNTP